MPMAIVGFISLFLSTSGQTHLSEAFNSGQFPPQDWTVENLPDQWILSNTSYAGGSEPEARFEWIQQIGITRLISPQVNLSGLSMVNFQFKHLYDDYTGEGPSIGISTRSGSGDWTSVWEVLPESSIGPETITLEISNDDVGQPDFQICCYLQGDFWNLDYWYLDDLVLYTPLTLDLTLFLEGPFKIDQMTNDLNTSGYLPLEQPFNVHPWNYSGTEMVTTIPNSSITDWILIEIIQINPMPHPDYSSVTKQAGFILQNGKITGIDGSSPLYFNIPQTDSLLVWVHHRNHFSATSSQKLFQNEGIQSIDLTQSITSVIYGKYAMKELSSGNWGLLAGDGNQDGQINNGDKYEIWLEQQGNSGYFSGDFNLDGSVNEADIDKIWNFNSGKSQWKPDTTLLPFPCGDTLLDNRDGKEYITVQIGNQCWMKENLNYETGTSWCYNNSSTNCNIYGRLYDWGTIMNGSSGSSSVPSGVQGICPVGWHIPSDGEWCILAKTVDTTFDCNLTGYNGTNAGIKLKSTWGWSSGGNGTNESGFNALPGGCMGIYHFDDLYLFSYFWSTTEDSPGYAWLLKLNYGLPTAGRFFSAKFRGYSTRCLKD